MAGRKKGAVRKGRGAMCNVCGFNCGKGGALKKHVESQHDVDYDSYKLCFYGEVNTLITDSWDDSVSTAKGTPVVIHVLARRFVGSPGARGVPRAARRVK